MQKIEPWVDVTCGKCGCLAFGSGYYYRGIITELRRSTRNWIVDDVYGTICPDCKADLKEERNEK